MGRLATPKAGPVECPCRQAVIRAYSEMIECGRCHCDAFRVANRVFRWHVPEMPEAQREARILSWVQPNWLN